MVIEFFQFPGVPSVRCAFCGRTLDGSTHGGNVSFDIGDDPAAVSANRTALLGRLGLSAWHELRQIHGTELVFDPAASDPCCASQELTPADGAMTTQPGLGLAIKTADCQPVLLTESTGRHIMALHCGWRGNRANFPGSAVKRFCAHYNIAPANVYAVRGPSLGPNQAEFTNFASEWGPQFSKWFAADTRTMNLWQLTRDQLSAAGVPENQIFGIDICTASNDDAWFSYRRDHASGRQAAVIWIESKENKEQP